MSQPHLTIYPRNYGGHQGCTVTIKYEPDKAKSFYWADINWFVLNYLDLVSVGSAPASSERWSSAKALS